MQKDSAAGMRSPSSNLVNGNLSPEKPADSGTWFPFYIYQWHIIGDGHTVHDFHRAIVQEADKISIH